MSGELQDFRDQAGATEVTAEQAVLDVAVSVKIEAESRRVLYALTIPEYMEAWLQMPDTEKLQCSADPRTPNSFLIDLYSSETSYARIECFCLLSNPDRIIYLWKNTCAGDTETMVGIHLRSGPGQCTVNLKHSGFCNKEESMWHSQMWHSSLDKLCRLMAKMNTPVHTSAKATKWTRSGYNRQWPEQQHV
jgi:uncharacterized protein YndB with AHSA1/START domain